MRITPIEQWIAEKINCNGQLNRIAIEKWQFERINATMKTAKMSPFYRDKLGYLDNIHELKEISRLPFTFPEEIANDGKRMLCVPQGEIERVVTLDTTGTTGLPKRLYFTREDQELTVDYFARGMATLIEPGESMLILLPGQRQGSVGELIYRALPRIQAKPYAYGLLKNLPDALDRLVKTRADTIVGVPVQVLALARYGKLLGIDITVKKVLLSTDNISQIIIRELQRIWGCEVYEHYGMTEMGLGGAIDCDAHEGYHIREADLYIEIVDPLTGEVLPEGQYGEVVFTTLTRNGMPLIRYRTGDISRFLTNPCRCGTVLKRLERIKRRKGGLVGIGKGLWIDLPALDEVLFSIPQIVDYHAEIIQAYKKERLIIKIASLEFYKKIEKEIVLQTLCSIEDIRLALERQELIIEINTIYHADITLLHNGKRSIKV